VRRLEEEAEGKDWPIGKSIRSQDGVGVMRRKEGDKEGEWGMDWVK
jgi:hypothetical protein